MDTRRDLISKLSFAATIPTPLKALVSQGGNLPLDGTEIVSGTKSGRTIQLSTGQIANYARPLSIVTSKIGTTKIADGLTSFVTSGFTTPGDHGGGTYVIAPAHPGPGVIQSADGRFWQLSDAPTAANLGTTNAEVLQGAEVATGLSEPRYLWQYLTQDQRLAVATNNYSSVDLNEFHAAFQEAVWAAEAHTLVLPARHFIKLNAPITMRGISKICTEGQGAPGAAVIYPDLRVNWQTTFPGRGLLESDNYTWGPKARSSKPDFWGGSTIDGLCLVGNYDYANRDNIRHIPDFGMVIWCPNEQCSLRKVVSSYFRQFGIFLGGTLSVPRIDDVSVCWNGSGNETILGDLASRPREPFLRPVSVFNTNHSSSEFITLEADTSNDLRTIMIGDVLLLSGTNYDINTGSLSIETTSVTVETIVGINEIPQPTLLYGVETASRFIVRLRAKSDLTGIKGRVFPAGIGCTNHPDRHFAKGIIASEGGRGSGGSADFSLVSGDGNHDALLFLDGSHILNFGGVKSEQNPSVLTVSGSANGAGRACVNLIGVRCDVGPNMISVIRVLGGGPDVNYLGGAPRNYDKLLIDCADKSVLTFNVSDYGGGPFFYSTRSPSHMSATKIKAGRLSVLDGRLSVSNVSNGDGNVCSIVVTGVEEITYSWEIGLNHAPFLSVDGRDGTGGYHIWCQDSDNARGSKCISLLNNGAMIGREHHKLGFFGSSPVNRQTVTGSTGGIQALKNLMLALESMGLINNETV